MKNTWGGPAGVTGESSMPQARFWILLAFTSPNSFTSSRRGYNCRSLTLTRPIVFNFSPVLYPIPVNTARQHRLVHIVKHSSHLHCTSGCFHFYPQVAEHLTRHSTQSCEAAHELSSAVRQKRRLLVGFKGAWYQLGQEFVVGDASAASQSQRVENGSSQLGCYHRADGQPAVLLIDHHIWGWEESDITFYSPQHLLINV